MTSGEEITTVLHLSTSSGPGGAERMISTLTAALNQDQFRIIAGLFRPGWLQEECEALGVRTSVLPLAGRFKFQWFRTCLRLLRKERVALIHAHEFSAILCGWIVAKLAGVPLVATIHGKNYFWEKLRRRVAYRLVSRQGTMITVSQDLKRFVCEKVGVAEKRLEVIYNGVAQAQTVTVEETQKCKAELGISGCYPILGVVGSLYPVKGHRFLLEAMPEILRRWPETRLLVIGRGELEVALKEQVEQLAIGANVDFLGMRQDVPRLLSVLDAFVLPSLSEGLSLALLEAMAYGKPVVTTLVGGNPELIDHGRTGFLVQPENARDLADNLVKLLSDPGMMQQFGRQAAERVRQHFSMGQMADRYREVYARCTLTQSQWQGLS
ncbi:MAG: glycosyltransferase family 4 protein [Acidobacteria bacterium]|nr:glycosyltransferase family 4 protein [Acidobacteriota bacterium]